jgi:hypothetical protein
MQRLCLTLLLAIAECIYSAVYNLLSNPFGQRGFDGV